MIANFSSLADFNAAFPTEKACIKHLEKLRWSNKVVSPFDETSKVYKCKDNKYFCNNTKKYGVLSSTSRKIRTVIPIGVIVFLLNFLKQHIHNMSLTRKRRKKKINIFGHTPFR